MSQSKLASLVEAKVNILVGFAINMVANLYLLPLFGVSIRASQAFGFGLAVTFISVARLYLLRRLFNWYELRRARTA